MKPVQLTYFRDKHGDHRWRIKHSNGRILAAASEGYTRLAGAKRNLARTKTALDQIFQQAVANLRALR